MKSILKFLAVVSIVASVPAATAFIFVLGQHVANNDHRLFKADDERRTRMVARACGKHGQLWQAPESGQYACIFINPDGSTLIHQISDAPILTVQR